MKKIFIYAYNLELGGIERSLIGLLEAANPNKYEIDLFLAKHEGELMGDIPEHINLLPVEKRYQAFGIPLTSAIKQGYLFESFARFIAKPIEKLLRIVKKDKALSVEAFIYHKMIIKKMKAQEKKYDLAVSFNMPYYYVLDKVTATKKVGLIHTDYSTVHIGTKAIINMFERIDQIQCVSKEVREKLISSLPVDEKKVGVAENILSVNSVKKAALENVDDMPNDSKYVLLSVGRFGTAKNFENIPNITRRLVEYGLDVKWYLIGFGGLESKIREEIEKNNMQNRVIILGKRENPYKYMNACTLYVQPSRFEGKAVTVREAQALNKPVCITAFPTANAQLENGVDGIIVPLDNEGCAKGIAELLKDTEKLEFLSNNCKTRDYSNASAVKDILDI
jgi:glycosyltransferase involved in cell wall biosynthesis